MVDLFSPQKRSAIMRAIKSADTKPEVLVRRLLFASGFRFRLHVKDLPGTPDIVLPKWKTVIFVNGCFWHAHQGCSYATRPHSNSAYWDAKLIRNKARDQEVRSILLSSGWRVIVVWECACKKKLTSRLQALMSDLIRGETGESYFEIGQDEIAVPIGQKP